MAGGVHLLCHQADHHLLLHTVVCEGIDFPPAGTLDLAGDVEVLEDDVAALVLPTLPLQVHLVHSGPQGEGSVLVDSVQDLGLDLRDGVAVEDPDDHLLLQLVLEDAAPDHPRGDGLPQESVLREAVASVLTALVHRSLLYLKLVRIVVLFLRRRGILNEIPRQCSTLSLSGYIYQHHTSKLLEMIPSWPLEKKYSSSIYQSDEIDL